MTDEDRKMLTTARDLLAEYTKDLAVLAGANMLRGVNAERRENMLALCYRSVKAIDAKLAEDNTP